MKFKLVRSAFLLAVGCVCSVSVAINYNGTIFDVKQPDGSSQVLYAWGNQNHYYLETNTGYTVIKDKNNGWLYYATVAQNEKSLISSGIKVGNPIDDKISAHVRPTASNETESTSESYTLPLTVRKTQPSRINTFKTMAFTPAPIQSIAAQDITSLDTTESNTIKVVMVKFADDESISAEAINPDDVDRLFNSTNFNEDNFPDPEDHETDEYKSWEKFYSVGSVKDYFKDVSEDEVTLNQTVEGWETSPENKSFYEIDYVQDPANWEDPNTPRGWWEGTTKLIEDVIGDTTAYDGVILIFNGRVEETTSSLRLHNGYIQNSDGSLTKYLITDSEYHTGLGMMTKAMGWMKFDWPRHNGNSFYYGDEYCLMAYDTSFDCPVRVSAQLRYQEGWQTPRIEGKTTDNMAEFTPVTLECNSDEIIMIKNPKNYDEDGEMEYFLIENRWYGRDDHRDDLIPQGGLAVWKVLTHKNSETDEIVTDRIRLMRGGLSYNQTFGPNTVPGTMFSSGHSGILISETDNPAETVSFKLEYVYPPAAEDGTIVIKGKEGSYNYLSEAMSIVEPGGTVLLAKDHTYQTEALNISGGKIFTVQPFDMENPYGLETPKAYDPNDPNEIIYNPEWAKDTKIEAFYNESVIRLIDSNATIKGLTVTNGNYVENLSNSEYGGGFYINRGAPIIEDCIITGNYAYRSGGGIYIQDAFLKSVYDHDLGEYVTRTTTIKNCHIYANKCDHASGGGIFAIKKDSDPDSLSNPLIQNCLIYNNEARWGGGIASDYDNRMEVINCTVADNYSDIEGGGIDCHDGSAFVVNSIIWGNESPSEFQVSLRDNQNDTYIYFHYSAIEGPIDFTDPNSTGEADELEMWVNGRKNLTSILPTDYDPEQLASIGNPMFAKSVKGTFEAPIIGDYHLKSKEGRWITPEEIAEIIKHDIAPSEPDGIINYFDYAELLNYMGIDSIDVGYDDKADFIDDDTIDMYDLMSLLNNWLEQYVVDDNGNAFIMDTTTSKCINSGDIDRIYSYEDETIANGYRINMGCYGGTVQASKSEKYAATIDGDSQINGYALLADLDGDDKITTIDALIFNTIKTDYEAWIADPFSDTNLTGVVEPADWREADFNNDDTVDMVDQAYFNRSYNWIEPWPTS